MNKVYKIPADKYELLMRSIRNADLITAMRILKGNLYEPLGNKTEKKQNKEYLTDKKMREIFKKEYRGLVFYNYDLEMWGGTAADLSKLKNKSYEIDLVKRILESEIKKLNFELVAVVTMSISDSEYFGWGKAHNNVNYDATGHILVGGLLWRDKISGRLISGVSRWQQGDFFLCDRNSHEDAIHRFIQDIVRYESFRSGLIRTKDL